MARLGFLRYKTNNRSLKRITKEGGGGVKNKTKQNKLKVDQYYNLLVLIGCHCHEGSLREDERQAHWRCRAFDFRNLLQVHLWLKLLH